MANNNDSLKMYKSLVEGIYSHDNSFKDNYLTASKVSFEAFVATNVLYAYYTVVKRRRTLGLYRADIDEAVCEDVLQACALATVEQWEEGERDVTALYKTACRTADKVYYHSSRGARTQEAKTLARWENERRTEGEPVMVLHPTRSFNITAEKSALVERIAVSQALNRAYDEGKITQYDLTVWTLVMRGYSSRKIAKRIGTNHKIIMRHFRKVVDILCNYIK